MFRAIIVAAPLILASLSVPTVAHANYGQQAAAQSGQCPNSSQRRARGRGIGNMLGSMAGMFGGQLGGVASTVVSVLPVGELLGEAIASMLDQCEQQKAAQATTQVVEQAAERGGSAVGTTVSWESETRPGVTGSSTVTAIDTASANGDCMTVTDIVIVDGEETRAPKQMCRRPPNNRFVRV
jgi:surface antigen